VRREADIDVGILSDLQRLDTLKRFLVAGGDAERGPPWAPVPVPWPQAASIAAMAKTIIIDFCILTFRSLGKNKKKIEWEQ